MRAVLQQFDRCSVAARTLQSCFKIRPPYVMLALSFVDQIWIILPLSLKETGFVAGV